MKLNQFISHLLAIVENNPELAEIPVIIKNDMTSREAKELMVVPRLAIAQEEGIENDFFILEGNNVKPEQANAIIIN